jgi:hypothetical protein
MTPKAILKAALASAALAACTPAVAADLDIDDGYRGGSAVVVNVHNRGFRHCHWIDGDRVCHRRGVPYAAYYNDDDYDEPYYGGYGYGWSPGIVLGFGGRYGGHYGHGGHHGGGWGGGHGGHGGHGGRH